MRPGMNTDLRAARVGGDFFLRASVQLVRLPYSGLPVKLGCHPQNIRGNNDIHLSDARRG